MTKGKRAIAEVDFDESEYIGSEDDGVYFTVAEGPDGWYMSAVVDCNSASFTDSLVTDDGPYPSEADAVMGGKNAAFEWCVNNDVRFNDEDDE